MHEQTLYSSSNENLTAYALLSQLNGLDRDTTSDLTSAAKEGRTAPFAPWYTKVSSQPLQLDKECRIALGFDKEQDFYPKVAEEADAWANLVLWGAKTKLLQDEEIANFIESPICSLQQMKNAKAIADQILNAYEEHVENHTVKVNDLLTSATRDLRINPDITDWYEIDASSDWGFNLSLDSNKFYGDGIAENDTAFNELSLRLEHGSVISVLAFDLDRFSLPVASVMFKTIALLARMARKGFALDMTYVTDYLDTYYLALEKLNLTEKDIQKIANTDYDTIEEVIVKEYPAVASYVLKEDQFVEYVYFMEAAMYLLATNSRKWYSNLYGDAYPTLPKLIKDVTELQPVTELDCKAKKYIEAVLETVTDLKEEETSAFIDSSDRLLENFALISFDSDFENYNLDSHNEDMQNVGEHGALKIDFNAGEKGFETISNIITADHCLMALASL